LGVAALSYDSAELLRVFAQRKGLDYPLLSDSESKVIRAFGILNENYARDHPGYGIPYPGMFIIDERGVVKAKYFEDDHRERYTAASILVHEFGEGGSAKTTIEAPHLSLSYGASDTRLSPGSRATLTLEIELKPRMHVYAPGVEGGYIPIDWKVAESKGWLAQPVSYPASRKLRLEAIRETVPVYMDRLRLTRDLIVGQPAELAPLLGPDQTLTVDGVFRYQACDDKECFPPQNVPLKWSFAIEKLDSQRAPIELQRKGKQ
jgi:AhpC/TSA family protein/cytochrome c biogenesis DsbD-like protein